MSASSTQFTFLVPRPDPDRERVQRIVLATPRPEPVREPDEVFLVDGVQHLDHRALLAPRYWTATRARLDPTQLEPELGPLTVPDPAPSSEQPASR